DLGFLDKDGELFVTGRLKDVIIIRGRNLYPQDLELTAERSHPALRSGCGAAFSIDADGGERLVLVHELDARAAADTGSVLDAVRKAVTEEHEAPLFAILLLAPGSLPKTSSGKVRRGPCR